MHQKEQSWIGKYTSWKKLKYFSVDFYAMKKVVNEYYRHAIAAKDAINEGNLEDAVEKFADAFRIRQNLSAKGLDKELICLRHALKLHVLGENRDSYELFRIGHFAKRLLRLKDNTFDKHYVGLILLNAMLYDDRPGSKIKRFNRALMHLEKYMRAGSSNIWQGTLTALILDAFGKKTEADDVYSGIYRTVKKDPATEYTFLPTVKGKVYTLGSSSLIRSLFLFKENESELGLMFESKCAALIKGILSNEPRISVSSIRMPIKDEEGNIYFSVIRRERCKTLDEVAIGREDAFELAEKGLALMHVKLQIPWLKRICFADQIARSVYSEHQKEEMIKNSLPIDASSMYAPVAFHSDAHPLNRGVAENGTVYIFDCENKGIRTVTQDLAKLFILSGFNGEDINEGIRNYVRFYNNILGADEKQKEIDEKSIALSFWNEAIALSFSYPSAMFASKEYEKVKAQLVSVGKADVIKIKDDFNEFYVNYRRNYESLERMLTRINN